MSFRKVFEQKTRPVANGQQPAECDKIDIKTVAAEFDRIKENSALKARSWLDESDSFTNMCCFEPISKMGTTSVTKCIISPVELLSIKFAAVVQSSLVNVNIQHYAKELNDALNNQPQLTKRGVGRPRKSPRTSPTVSSLSFVDYTTYPQLSTSRIQLQLFPLPKHHWENDIIFLELFMNIDWNIKGQHTNKQVLGMMVSIQREGEWIQKCIPVDNILEGLSHNPTKRAWLITQLQLKYDIDSKQSMDNPSNLRLVPLIMNKCDFHDDCDNNGYVMCASHGQCFCKLHKSSIHNHPDNDLGKRQLSQEIGCKCDSSSTHPKFMIQPRLNMIYYYFFLDDTSEDQQHQEEEEEDCWEFNPVNNAFLLIQYRLLCPGLSVFNPRKIRSLCKSSADGGGVIQALESNTRKLWSSGPVASRYWLSFFGHTDWSSNKSPHWVLQGDTLEPIPMSDFVISVGKNTDYFKSNLPIESELLITMLGCNLSSALGTNLISCKDLFLDIPKARNQYVIFIGGASIKFTHYSTFPETLREFWQDRGLCLREAFRKAVPVSSIKCNFQLITHIDDTTREITSYSNHQFTETMYQKIDDQWSPAEKKKPFITTTSSSAATNTPPITTTPSVSKEEFLLNRRQTYRAQRKANRKVEKNEKRKLTTHPYTQHQTTHSFSSHTLQHQLISSIISTQSALVDIAKQLGHKL